MVKSTRSRNRFPASGSLVAAALIRLGDTFTAGGGGRLPAQSRTGRNTRYELVFLPGLECVVTDEAKRVLHRAPVRVPGRSDAMSVDFAGQWRVLASLRTPVAVFAVLTFAVPRPKSLLSGEYFPDIVATVRRVRPAGSFRLEAAGANSPVFLRLADQLSAATGLAHDPDQGDVVVRFRRSLTVDGWDVLVRTTPRPLSHRPWRVRNFPGAANATVAAAMAMLTGVRPADRVVNLMCGSGTLLIERMLLGPVDRALAVDSHSDSLGACAENLSAAGLDGRATLLRADISSADWQSHGPFDVLLADPPWGGLVGEHATNERLHLDLLRRAHVAAANSARFAVLTHEIRQMERCLHSTQDLWRVQSVTRVFQKGHHPRIYLLRPANSRHASDQRAESSSTV